MELLETFLTGSATSANVLFGNLQLSAATDLGVSKYWVVAANMTGATAGMLSPQNIAVATGAINREGDEGEILKETVKWGSLYLVICCVFLYVVGLVAGMDLMDEKLKSVLLSMKTQPDITGDVEAMTIIDHALSEIEQDIDLNKVIFKLNQEIDNY